MDACYTPEQDAGEGQSLLIIRQDERATQAGLLVRPNRSLSLRGMAMMFAGLTVFALVVSVGFWLAGAWLVLPFAGLELAVVGAVLYRLVRHRDNHERVAVDRDHVTVVRCRGGHERCDQFQRYWAKVSLERRRGWYPSRLLVGSHGCWVEIGADINEEERALLAARLRKILRRPAGNG